MTEGAWNDGAIRVLVVDDHDLFRAGLASLLDAQPEIEVVAQASGGRMGVRLTNELQPDVVLMDLRMPDLEGPEATREIMERLPDTSVVALTVVSDDADVAAAVEAGACGFLAKDTPIDGVVLAVRAAANGVAWLSPRAAEVVLGRVRRDGAEEEPDTDLVDELSSARARGAAADRPWDGERRDRAGARHQSADRQESCLEHPGQARTAQPDPGRDLCRPSRPELTAAPHRRRRPLCPGGEHEAKGQPTRLDVVHGTEFGDGLPERCDRLPYLRLDEVRVIRPTTHGETGRLQRDQGGAAGLERRLQVIEGWLNVPRLRRHLWT